VGKATLEIKLSEIYSWDEEIFLPGESKATNSLRRLAISDVQVMLTTQKKRGFDSL
jgi:hypothetical protein